MDGSYYTASLSLITFSIYSEEERRELVSVGGCVGDLSRSVNIWEEGVAVAGLCTY